MTYHIPTTLFNHYSVKRFLEGADAVRHAITIANMACETDSREELLRRIEDEIGIMFEVKFPHGHWN